VAQCDLGFFDRRYGGQDSSSQCAAQFDGGEPHTAGRPQHQQCLARLQRPSVDQCVVRRSIGHLKRCRHVEWQIVGDRNTPRVGGAHPFGESTARYARHNTLSRFEACDVFGYRIDDAGYLDARGERPFGPKLILVFDHENVGIIYAASANRDANLPGCRLRLRHVGHHQVLRPAASSTQQSLHQCHLEIWREHG